MIDTTPAPFPQTSHRVVRCECRNCGVHTMAATDPEATVRCPNCGSHVLTAIGVDPLYRSPAVEQMRRALVAGLIESDGPIGASGGALFRTQ